MDDVEKRDGDGPGTVEEKSETSGSEDAVVVKKSDTEPAEAWLKVVGTFFLFFIIWGIPMTFGAFQSTYTLEILEGTSPSAISWIGTVQAALLVATGFVAGPLYDLGYWRVMVAVGSVLTVFGLMMVSISTEYYQIFLSQGVCVGIGCGLFYIPCLSLLGNTFSKNRAIALGVSTSGITLGAIIYTITYLQLIDRIGFPWTVRIIAFISLAVFVLAVPLVVAGTPPTSGTVRSLFDRSAFADVPFLLFSVAQFFIFLGYLVPMFYIPIYARVVFGSSERQSLYILAGVQAASLFGRIFASLAARRVGVMIPWVLCCGVSGVLCMAWIAVRTFGGLVAFALLYGLFSGALIALPPGLFPTICPDPAKLGSRMGLSWTATAVGTLGSSPIGGALVQLESANFLGAQVWSGAVLLFSLVFLAVLWVMLGRRHGTFMI